MPAGAWVHVDGAFGLWAAAVPALRSPCCGASPRPTPGPPTLTSGSTFPTTAASPSSGMARRCGRPCRSPRNICHRRRAPESVGLHAGTFAPGPGSGGVGGPARRWDATGLVELIERNCRQARRFAEGLRAAGYDVLNDVVLNQVLVSFGDAEPDQPGHRRGAGGRHLLVWRDGLAGEDRDADQRLILGHHRRRCRAKP